MKDDSSDCSSNHTVDFVKCDYCEKIYDSYSLRWLNQHVSKSHPEHYEEYKEKYPERFKKEIDKKEDVNMNKLPDYRTQDQSDQSFIFKCAICLFRLKGRTGANNHLMKYHNNTPFQLGNTMLHCDPQLEAEQREKLNLKYRCGHCLMCFSKIESIKTHLNDKHSGMEQLVYSIKGNVQENLEKVCFKTKICDDMIIKHWKIDERLNSKLEPIVKEDEDDKPQGKMLLKKKITKVEDIKVNKEEYNKILHNLNIIKKMDTFKSDLDIKELYEQTLEIMAKYA